MLNNSKREILKTLPIDNCCSYSFLSSLFSNSKISYFQHKLFIELPEFIIPRFKNILEHFYPNIAIKKDNEQIVLCGQDVEQLLLDSGVVKNCNFANLDYDGINQDILASECCKLTYLKVLYLLTANYYYTKNNNERSSGYSVEFNFKNFALADDSKALMKYFGLKVGMVKRGNNIIIYIKDSEMIYKLFVLLEAVESAMEIQNNLIIRELRNDANRQGNCFDANLNKTLNASRQQVKAIDYIIKNYGLEYLDESLQETALLRIANEDLTLNELQKLYSQPITRAGLKYKLDKIIAIYQKLIS